jgi:hypothetical protein
MIISSSLPFCAGVHWEEVTFQQCVPTGNTSESPMPFPASKSGSEKRFSHPYSGTGSHFALNTVIKTGYRTF